MGMHVDTLCLASDLLETVSWCITHSLLMTIVSRRLGLAEYTVTLISRKVIEQLC